MISPATRELVLLQARELVRDRRYFAFALVFPFGMLAIFLGIGAMMPPDAGAPDFTQFIVPMALFLAVTSTALTVTAGPLAGLRSRGTLRLLGTTPLTRTRLVLSHLSVRVVMVTVQAILLLAIAYAIGAVRAGSLPALFGISMLGLAMFLSVGYLVGGRMTSPDAATNVGTLIQLGSLFLSGLAFPLRFMPEALANTLSLLPTTFFADLLSSQMPGGQPFHPAWLSVLVVTATTVVFMTLAIRTFRWDQGEDDGRRPSRSSRTGRGTPPRDTSTELAGSSALHAER